MIKTAKDTISKTAGLRGSQPPTKMTKNAEKKNVEEEEDVVRNGEKLRELQKFEKVSKKRKRGERVKNH